MRHDLWLEVDGRVQWFGHSVRLEIRGSDLATSADFQARRMGSALLGAALLVFAGWLAYRNLRLSTRDGFIFWVPIALWLTTMGVLCWWGALGAREPDARAQLAASWRAGWLVGMAGLAIGFVGPLVVNPKASLGPLLGILISGPAGFVLGAFGGALMHGARRAS
jgi:hypothetical protein